MAFKRIVICAGDKKVGDMVKMMCALFFAKHFPKKTVEFIDVIAYDNKISQYGVDYAEHIESRHLKKYFNKARAMVNHLAGTGILVIFLPKVVDKIRANHAMASIGVAAGKHMSFHGRYVKMKSGSNRPSGSDKVRKWYCN
jgi:uncharacterized protein